MSEQDEKDLKFGKIAIQKGYATREQVKECLRIQERLREGGGSPSRLGIMLMEEGYITREEAENVARIQGRLVKMADIPGYEFEKKLGEGGMGAVYKARQVSLDRPVAIKIFDHKKNDDPSFRDQFLREARTVAKLDHDHIIKGIDAGAENGTYYFVMEFVEGKTVKDEVREKGIIAQKRALRIALQVAMALNHADQNNLIHRDIKPDNIMITRGNQVKVCDLGLAKPRQEVNEAISKPDSGSTRQGSPYYMAPEVIKEREHLDIRTDLYSLGATLYAVVTGEAPFTGDSYREVLQMHLNELPVPPKEINPDLSDGLNAMIQKLMEKDPGNRYQNCVQLIEDLHRELEGQELKYVERSGEEDVFEESSLSERDTEAIRETLSSPEQSSTKRRTGAQKRRVSGRSRSRGVGGVMFTVFAIGCGTLLAGFLLFQFSGESGDSRTISVETGEDPRAAFVRSVQSGNSEAVKKYLEDGGDPDVKGNRLDPVLVQASRKGHEGIVKTLLKYEVNVDGKGRNGNTALISAAKRGYDEIVKLLLQNGARVNVKNQKGDSALLLASLEGHHKTVNVLLEHGAKVNTKNHHGNTALFAACRKGHSKIVRTVLNHGADPNLKTRTGSPLIHAAKEGREETAEVLLKNGAKVNLKTKRSTALINAVLNQRTGVIKVLLKHGADKDMKDLEGKSAVMVARAKRFAEIFHLLNEYSSEHQ